MFRISETFYKLYIVGILNLILINKHLGMCRSSYE